MEIFALDLRHVDDSTTTGDVNTYPAASVPSGTIVRQPFALSGGHGVVSLRKDQPVRFLGSRVHQPGVLAVTVGVRSTGRMRTFLVAADATIEVAA